MKIATCFLFLTLSSLEASALPTSIALGVGEQISIKKDFKGSLTITNPKVAKVTVQGFQIQIVGKQPGELRLLSKNHSTTITVYTPKLRQAKIAVDELIRRSPGIESEIGSHKIILRGQAFRLLDWHQLQGVKNQYSSFIENQVLLDPRLLEQLKTTIITALKRHSVFSTEVSISDGRVQLQSSAKSPDEKSLIKRISQEWGLPPTDLSKNLELRPMIEIDIVIAEVKKNSASAIGLQLPGTYSATILPAGDLSSAATTFDGITPQLHAIITEGQGKVLANPRLLCRSGEVAHFVAGGQIPLKVHSMRTAEVLWKSYGVILDISPLADSNDGISTKLVTEISLLDEAHKIDGIPGLLTNRIETHFDLRGTKTIALSGLIKSETGKSASSTPFLRDIPILGELFKSNDFKENRTELVVFVTPRIISPENPPPSPRIPQWDQDL